MDKSLAALVKVLAKAYTAEIEAQRFNGMMPKTLHMRALRKAADEIIDINAFDNYQNTLANVSLSDHRGKLPTGLLKGTDSKNS